MGILTPVNAQLLLLQVEVDVFQPLLLGVGRQPVVHLSLIHI